MTSPSETPDANRHPDERNTPTWRFRGFAPNHPWYYLPDGDNQPPLPVDQIAPFAAEGAPVREKLARKAVKREQQLRDLLAREEAALAERIARYADVVQRGADALSKYDREIAYGGNLELARASSLALFVNQISWLKGRIAWLKRELEAYGLTLF
ncbi:MAG: hypothetical protein SF069_11025 [Phycisphaerae bacterium]|nr:hypothetical protein [Phycisphaerae bacterium]